MATIRDVLAGVSFGQMVAEEEIDTLHAYFVETEQYNKLLDGQIDLVYGPKGSGKSALYALLFTGGETYPLIGKDKSKSRTIGIGVANPQESGVFDEIRSIPQAAEEDFRRLWKLYFLVVLATYVRDVTAWDQIESSDVAKLMNLLVELKLLPPRKENCGWRSHLAAAAAFVKRYKPAVEGEMAWNPATNTPSFTGKLTFEEASEEEKHLGVISIADALHLLNKFIKRFDLRVWIGLDRLDAAFSDDRYMESIALRALFRVYIDMKSMSNLKLKIFLRDDLWLQLTQMEEKGFREATHMSRYTKITWDKNSLLNLVIKRAMDSQAIRDFYKRRDDIFHDIVKQESLFNEMFPQKMGNGKRQTGTLDWMLGRTQDGTGRSCPRELLHLIRTARDKQMRKFEQGVTSPDGRELISAQALQDALPEVSEFRYLNTFCAEHPKLAIHTNKLQGKKATQTAETLATAFNKTTGEALEIAEALVGAGFLAKKTIRGRTEYKIPYLYRDALRIH